MYEIDFLPVEAKDGPSTKSGDAICVRFVDGLGYSRVLIIDAGFAAMGESVVEFVRAKYGTEQIDLVISTHPDRDHLNGLQTVIEQLRVTELLIHCPRRHVASLTNFTNLEAVDDLLAAAQRNATTITEPFAGLTRFGGQLRILGPTAQLYKETLAEQIVSSAEARGSGVARWWFGERGGMRDLLKRALSWYPAETLGEDGVTSPRNEGSVVTLLTVDGRRLMFTGDAGLRGLDDAASEYETSVGAFAVAPLQFFQVPHHGSRRNLSPTLLDRILGRPGHAFAPITAFVSSAKGDPKHPSPKVTNALGRRDAAVCATEGRSILSSYDAEQRPEYGPIDPIGPLVEDDDA